jgi:DMSO/TMAO reductase YedYZ molybdopterin-dependent catalytic subunit
MRGQATAGRLLGAARDVWAHGGPGAEGLPPGQGVARTFPRFGVHFADPPPDVPERPSLEVGGAVEAPLDLALSDLEEMPRRTLVADFHCVAGWSVRDLRWEGVPFRTLWEETILPRARPRGEITHLVLTGLDGYRSTLTLQDALADDVLVADRLDGAPLSGDHGAPARLVSPKQYGYMNTKHLCRVDLHTREPTGAWHPSSLRAFGLSVVAPHPRARVAHEERHARLPAWSVRFVYRRIVLPVLGAVMVSREGSE